ncbi:neural cell adhesion molecule 2 [Teleopsis dalmanni]|uniref:neural cell adhesion molecule 2 n=1 Tax=Teleopsis dalmanni TaxID=139649 RepID=UPI0018CCAB00|nr:neural cell adhesion molecule 2 [Teleopsis dalmanni]
MDLWFLLCLLLLNKTVTVFGQLGGSLIMLTPSTPSITHFVNDSFIIKCNPLQKDINVKWRDPKGITFENKKGRVHIEQRDKSGWALVFTHIALEDKGNWTCEASLADGAAAREAKKSFELLVNQKISFDKTEMVQSAREGRDATVYCFVKGDPMPDISWLYNGEYINTASSTKHKRLSDGLFIKNVTQADAGEYTCRAMRITPTFSDSDQITILLRIQHKPHWTFNESERIQFAYVGGTVNISCEAMGEPPPSFKWVHDGSALAGRNYRVFYADYGSTLQIHVKNETQFGDYKCKVSNPLGMLERTINLSKGQKPGRPTRFQLKRLFVDGFELDIKSVKYSNVEENMQIFGYCVEYMSDNDFKYSAGNWSYAKKKEFSFHQGNRFIIVGLDRNTTYFLRASSRNLAGLSDWTPVMQFATLSNFSIKLSNVSIWKTCLVVLVGFIVVNRFKHF